MGTIVTTADAGTNVPRFAALPSAQQAALVAGVTDALNEGTKRILPLTWHDERHAPENRRSLWLKQYPVWRVKRLGVGLAPVLTIRCTDPDATRATVEYTASGTGDTLAITGITLVKVAGGSEADTPLAFADYPTVQALAAAIAGQAGWSATVGSQASWSCADLNPDLGARGALGGGAALWAFTRDLDRYTVDGATGQIQIHEDLPPSHSFPDRLWAASGQFGDVRAIYQAGFNPDPLAGPVTMPDALKQAAYILIQLLLGKVKVGVFQQEARLGGTNVYTDAALGLLPQVKDWYGPFRRRRMV